ncbi:MAG: hypothetical protein MI976_23965 [Pseudomonadales bacterium]|nr:hypothetical protein [Pseudomonadales bacterium]
MFQSENRGQYYKMMSKRLVVPAFTVSLMAIVGLSMGCSTQSVSATTPKTIAQAVTIIEEIPLASAIEETSGLFCDKDGAVTINDSGNKAVVYTMGLDGEIISKHKIAAKNNDWEAITADTEYYYIGDIGNNRGRRSDLQILKISRSNHGLNASIPIHYIANTPHANKAYDHDFDGEALVAKNNYLLLFSKSWKSQALHIYKVSKAGGNAALVPIKSVTGLPGLVTGADWSEFLNSYLLVGYKVRALGGFESFIALLDQEFNIVSTQALTLGQIEGVCAHHSGDIWITQEGAGKQPAKLFKLRLQN